LELVVAGLVLAAVLEAGAVPGQEPALDLAGDLGDRARRGDGDARTRHAAGVGAEAVGQAPSEGYPVAAGSLVERQQHPLVLGAGQEGLPGAGAELWGPSPRQGAG
jgi:hypothetical protein